MSCLTPSGPAGVSEDGNSQDAIEGLDTMQAEGALRLTGGQAGPGFEYGRLEIFLKGFWRSVCDNFTPDSAKVACTVLGFDGGAVLRNLVRSRSCWLTRCNKIRMAVIVVTNVKTTD